MKKTNVQIITEIQLLLNQLSESLDIKQEKEISKVSVSSKKDNSYSGCAGGLKLLINENYLDEPHTKQEVENKLKEMGRHYTSELISMNLLNLCKNRTLVKLGNRGNYKFVIRK